MSNHIVIGANFGDEGKGLVTNYLAEKHKNNIVVRFNGGGQAGHTVELDDGRRHEFHHISSGTFQGSPTLLSEHFVFNPNVLLQELMQLPHEKPRIFVHRNAMLSTPFDWMLNRAIEDKRAGNKHGSCGMGINETVTRCEFYSTTVEDMFHLDTLREKLRIIQDEWVPKRAKELGVDPNIDFNIDDYMADCLTAGAIIYIINNYKILKSFDNVIFEGAQGLLLDEYHRFFPHVTRSRTGSTNPVEILKSIGEKEANVHYVTRTYLTRHGAGPMPYEDSSYAKEDLTNLTNKYQDNLRFGPLDTALLRSSIFNDLNVDFFLKPEIMVTWGNHKDPVVGQMDTYEGNKLKGILPIARQTWFHDRTSSSVGEILHANR